MNRLGCFIVVVVVIAGLVLTFPIWGMVVAVFFDSDRTVLVSKKSPDGVKIAQVERMVVGGVPSQSIQVRSSWLPNWYLSGCSVGLFYDSDGIDVRIDWVSDSELAVSSDGEVPLWEGDMAAFVGACDDLKVTSAHSNKGT